MKAKLTVLAFMVLVLVGVIFAMPLARFIFPPPPAEDEPLPQVIQPAGPEVKPEALHFPTPTPAPRPVDIPLMPAGVFDFPALHLTSELHPFRADRRHWHDGTLYITGTNTPFIMEETAVRIRGRGMTTWDYGADKRPLRIRFASAQTILDSPHAAQDWVLIANLFDMSLIRTHMAFYLAGLLEGMDWAPFSRLVHLYVNGEYKGVYQLADERNTEEGRAPLSFHPDPAYSEFLFEKNGIQARREWLISIGNTEGVDFLFVNRWVINVRYPRQADHNGHMEYLYDFLYRVDEAILSQDFEAVSALIDLPSLVDFYLMQEWFKEIDVPSHSVFMQIRHTGDARRLYFGPAWDFDRSAGNLRFYYMPEYIYAGQNNLWFANLLQIPEFFYLVAARWREISADHVPRTLAHMQYLLDYYEPALARNFDAHSQIFGYSPNWFIRVPETVQEIHTLRGQLEYLIDWMTIRAAWLDGFFI